jgi:hypothetical protein
MGIECLLANAQLVRQIIHGNTAESVTEKVCTRSLHNSLLAELALSLARRRFL